MLFLSAHARVRYVTSFIRTRKVLCWCSTSPANPVLRRLTRGSMRWNRILAARPNWTMSSSLFVETRSVTQARDEDFLGDGPTDLPCPFIQIPAFLSSPPLNFWFPWFHSVSFFPSCSRSLWVFSSQVGPGDAQPPNAFLCNQWLKLLPCKQRKSDLTDNIYKWVVCLLEEGCGGLLVP